MGLLFVKVVHAWKGILNISYPGRGLFWLGFSWGQDTLKYLLVVYLVDKDGVGDFFGLAGYVGG